MKTRNLALATLCLAACSTPEKRTEASLMDEVERHVRLPEEAMSLDQYGRYYAAHDGKVVGLYVVPSEPDPNSTCEALTENLTPTPTECPPEPEQLAAGTRRWVDYEELPGITDGGCTVVSVLFDPATHRVEQAECNGVA